MNEEMEEWWEGLSDKEKIVAVLEALETDGAWRAGDAPSYWASKPWKWKAEAFHEHKRRESGASA